ncbi:hypothetical protein RJT34_22532 [Clitoria ternatea]|uniref:RING-type E3 ubiquitin transferase n=1 Tax=Clitoria ternatea TaxID=43366 RepID=A0AAN9FT16_CLITE
MLHIRREHFKSAENTLENGECCCIFQDDYIHGEEDEKLNCKHKFHIGCIKQWPRRKNACPIRKQTTLVMNVVRDDADDDDDEGGGDDERDDKDNGDY